MGKLVDGEWKQAEYADQSGKFVRERTVFREVVEDRAGARFPLARDRYHLYVSYACPWAHRTLITRALKGLEEALPVTVVDPFMGDQGWSFSDRMGCSPDPNLHARYLRELYLAADPKFTGRVTVPVLWDKQQNTIVNNESRDLVKLFDRAFAALATRSTEVWPKRKEQAIEAMIDANYASINNGVYRAGFASTQAAYEEAMHEVFEGLERCERVLEQQPFLCGVQATAADICLFTTLLRFEPVYHYHFKCNLRSLRSYPNLWELTRALYQVPQVKATCRLDHIKLHYYQSHPHLNPNRIVPVGPVLDLEAEVSPERRAPFGLEVPNLPESAHPA